MHKFKNYFGKWTFCYNEDQWDPSDQTVYDTFEQAKKEASKQATEQTFTIFIGQIARPDFEIGINTVKKIIADVQDQFCEQDGEAAVEWMDTPWLDPWNKNQYTEEQIHGMENKYHSKLLYLAGKVKEAVNEWMVEVEETPEFLCVKNVKCITFVEENRLKAS